MNYELLKEKRKDMGLTIVKLMELSGVHRETLSMIERGIADPHMSTLIKISKILKLKISFLE